MNEWSYLIDRHRWENSLLNCFRLMGLFAFLVMAIPNAQAENFSSAQQVADLAPQSRSAGEPVLTLVTRSGLEEMTIQQIEDLGMQVMETRTPIDRDSKAYSGVLLRDLFARTGLSASKAVRVISHDGNRQVLWASDWQKWPIMLATRANDQSLDRRDKGPTRLIYPATNQPDFLRARYRARWVWMISRIEELEIR